MIEILFTYFEEPFPDFLWNDWLDKMPAAIRERTLRYYRWQDRHSFLLGRMLLQKGLLRYGLDASALEKITLTNFGKPYLGQDIDFNVSHSGKIVVCAFSKTARIGIDVESLRDIDWHGLEKCFTGEEWELIRNSQNPSQTFFRTWTRKESVIKADGRGLSIPLDAISTVSGRVFYGSAQWYLQDIFLDSGHPCCLAANTNQAAIQVIPVNFSES